jgi:hypothetical protein
VLINLLSQPVAARPPRTAILERLRAQSAEEALLVIEAVRLAGCNGRSARGLGLSFLLGHERLAGLAATRRTRLVRLLAHLLGERTWSSGVRCLRTGAATGPAAPRPRGLLPPDLVVRLFARKPPTRAADPEAFLRRAVLRYAPDPAAARAALRVLAGDVFETGEVALARRLAERRDLEQGAGLPRATLFGLRGTFHPRVPAGRVRCPSSSVAAQAVVPRDGPLTALFKSALAAGANLPAGRRCRIGWRRLRRRSRRSTRPWRSSSTCPARPRPRASGPIIRPHSGWP